jgi:MFS family permease
MILRPGAALGSTLLVQTLASLVLTAPSVLAPAVAPTLGLRPESVGMFVGVAYLAAMLSGLGSGGWVNRIGAVRLSQVAMLACTCGTLGVIAGLPVLMGLAALTIGAGYGMINPAASSLLARHSPPASRGLFFSVKQTGVPLGVALSGLLLPWGLHTIGWRPSILIAGAACAAMALMLRPMIAKLEPFAAGRIRSPGRETDIADRGATGTGTETGPGASAETDAPAKDRPGLMMVLRDPALRRLSLTSFAFACTQLCFITFLVSYLNLELGQSLALAAGILAASQAISTASRIAWGVVADRWIGPGWLLGALGLAMSAACVGLGLLSASSGTGLIVAAAVVCAATTMGWNGVYFAELTHHSTHANMAALAGASQFLTFSGSMAGPVLFGELIRHGGSYSTAYLVLAVLPAVAGAFMLRAAIVGNRHRAQDSGL